MKSIIASEPECFICESPFIEPPHHLIFGQGLRPLSEKYGLKIYLCPAHHRWCHQESYKHKEFARQMRILGQLAFESRWGNRAEFLRVFRINYIYDIEPDYNKLIRELQQAA